jgi:hypothetical protein
VEGRLQQGLHEGPFWSILDPQWPPFAGSSHATLRWVRLHELWWRPDGGRNWNSLEVFKGYDYTITERAHLLKECQTGDFYCRFLRFVPIDLEYGGAVRIGIYGERMEETIAISTQTAAVEKGPSDVLDLESMVEYRLLHPPPVKVLGAMQRDIFCPSAHDKSSKRRISRIRCKRAQQL